MFEWIFGIIVFYFFIFLLAFITAKEDMSKFSLFAQILFLPIILMVVGIILVIEFLFINKLKKKGDKHG